MIFKKEYSQSIVIAGLITDGATRIKKPNKYLIQFFNNDHSLHKVFQKAMKQGFNSTKGSYYWDKTQGERLYVTKYELSRINPIVNDLLTLSPTFITKRIDEKQPTIKFLLAQDLDIKVIALRFAMSCDGCIAISKKKNGQLKPALKFACAHPNLVYEWKELFEDIGIDMRIDKDHSTWSGIHGLVSTKKASIKRFKELNGFYPKNALVERGNYKGKQKNYTLDLACKLIS